MRDGISELPEPILHHIMSSLPSEDVARTSILSKSWNSVWESFPIMDFDEEKFAAAMGMEDPDYMFTVKITDKIMNIRERFANYVDGSVTRSRQRMISIQKFRLRMGFYDLNLASYIDRWVEYAIESNAKELDVNLEIRRGKWYNVPQSIFRNKGMTQLSLQGCKLEKCDDMKLPSLRTLALWEVLVDEETLNNLISNCPLLEYLIIVYCYGWRNLKVSSTRLKNMNLFLTNGSPIQKVDIEAPNLSSFCYDGESIPCVMSMATFENVKVFSLSGANIRGNFFQDFSKFPMVEELYLDGCKMLESIKISSFRLRKLSLICCEKLVDAEIDAPNLLSFKYKERKLISLSLMNTSDSLEAYICLEYMSLDTFCFMNLAEFLSNFGHCKVLKLRGGPKMNVIIPENLRGDMIPPLRNVEHLKLSLVSLSLRNTAVEALVDGLLWMAPNLHSLSIATYSDKSLKFIFEDRMVGENDKYHSKTHNGKSWQHYLKEVEIVNSNGAEEEMDLKKFFTEIARTSNTVST